jgi:hypothetical protein
MARLPARSAPYIYGIIQAAITTAVATGIATYQLLGPGMAFLESWPASWLLAWLTMLPAVLVGAPLIHGLVRRITVPPFSSGPHS